MRVTVDPGRCQGHNRCLDLAPDLFVGDEFGYASAAGDGSVPAGREGEAGLAVLNCPEEAIDVVD